MTDQPYLSQLQVLQGMRLASIGAAADLLWMHFGSLRTVATSRGGTKQVGEWALHLQCPWRLVRAGTVVLGSRDFYYRATDGEPVAEFGKEESIFLRKVPSLDQYLGQSVVKVASVIDRSAGAFDLELDDGAMMSVMPVDSEVRSYGESWRMFRPASDEKHFIYPDEG